MENIYKDMYNQKRLDLKDTPRIRIMAGLADGLRLTNKRILDIGCYDGMFLSLLKNRNNFFYGIEASDYGVSASKKKGIDVRQFFFDGKENVPFSDGFFDLIVSGEVIEHIYDTDFFLQEIYRLLAPSGKLLISTPNIASLGRRIMLLLGINPIIEVSPHEENSSGHIRYFTFQSLKTLLEKHKFRIITRTSDVINFSGDGRIKCSAIPKMLSVFGQSIIYLCGKNI